ncbi:unnamed protein product [Prunus brigantina]
MQSMDWKEWFQQEGIFASKVGKVCRFCCPQETSTVDICENQPTLVCNLHQDWYRVVPDNPSERMMNLPTTRKLALKNKVVFGTGDYWCAPTVKANMAFVRAISQIGMSLFTIEHRPRALTGD